MRENQILDFVIRYFSVHGYCPSVREIGKGVGLSSSHTVHKYIRKMIDCGMLETDKIPGRSRALRVPGYRFMKVES